ncbi:hypothetical protein [Anaerosporobacter faecicola]|uniref:hypothetical protein n=1 Tax=Anaerosporobacter faecicola TaxID=2718714 RepID=UPI00143A7610|nr:hypothetical protein [Anaerosporobacter faecicola]
MLHLIKQKLYEIGYYLRKEEASVVLPLSPYGKGDLIVAKETRLDDSAGIYEKREKQTERQKMQDMTFKEKVQYFNMYYLKKVIFGVIALVFVSYLLFETLSPKPDELLNIAVVNDYFDQTKVKEFLKDLDTHFDVDPDKEVINFDYSYYIAENDVSENSVSSIQKLSTYIAAKQIDVIIADETNFKQLAANGYFYNLSDLLPADQFSKLTESFCMGTISENNLPKGELSAGECPYGIYLTDSSVYKNSGSTITKPILGVVCNTPNKEHVLELISYLLNLD